MKLLKSIIGILLIGLSVYGVKFLYDLSFSGSKYVKIIENHDEISSIDELINKPEFKDKILYIDLWGVYCKPCIHQFQFIPALKEKLKNIEIEYVYLATPYGHLVDEQLWKSGMKKHHLEGHNALMNQDFYTNIWDQVPEMANKWTIPHYILVDRNGIIVNANAPSPSQLDELLAEIKKHAG